MEITPTETTAEERLPWHKPEIQQLEVSLDTQLRTGSNADLQDGDLLVTGG